MNCTPEALKQIMFCIAAYLSEEHGCTYSRLVEVLRETVPGLEKLCYQDIYPILFNISAKYPEEELCPYYDCDSLAKEFFHSNKKEE